MKKFEVELPENYDVLKKQANYTSSWRERKEAVVTLSAIKHDKVIDLLQNRLKNDTVLEVRNEAYKALKAFGEKVEKPVPAKYELIKGTDKVLLRVKKSLPKEHTVEQFADKLKRMRLDIYDAYEGDKGEQFMSWLEQRWTQL